MNQPRKHNYYDDSESKSKNKRSSSRSSSGNEDNGKDAGHFKYKIGQIINNFKVRNLSFFVYNSYNKQILQHLGDGTFGRCLEVKDLDTHKVYAMKVINQYI